MTFFLKTKNRPGYVPKCPALWAEALGPNIGNITKYRIANNEHFVNERNGDYVQIILTERPLEEAGAPRF